MEKENISQQSTTGTEKDEKPVSEKLPELNTNSFHDVKALLFQM